MQRHSGYDHELKIGTTTERYKLIRDENGSVMYNVDIEEFQYRNPLRYIQRNWIGGHGQHNYNANEKNDMYFEGQSIDTTQEGRVFLGPLINPLGETGDSGNLDTAVNGFCWDSINSQLLCWTDAKIYLHSAAGWTDASVTDVPDVTDIKVFGSYLFAACGTSAYRYSTDGNTWVTSTLATTAFEKFLVAPNPAGTADVLWGFIKPNQVYSNTGTGINGGTEWGSANYIGDSSTNITNIFLINDRIMIGREDGLWFFDSDGGIHSLRDDLINNRSTDNFKYVTTWQASTYFSEIDGMGEIYANDLYEPMGPLTKVGGGPFENIGKRGDIVGLAADKDWLYVAIDEGTNSHIYKGREVRKNGVLRWEWCPWVFLGESACASIITCQHSTTDRRLWFGYATTTGYVVLSDDPTTDTAAGFCTDGWLRMSYDYGTNPEWDEMWQSAVLEVSGGDTGETVEIKYRMDTDTGGTSIVTAAATNGVFETNFGAEKSSNRIQFEIHLASNTSTTTPEVSYFEAKGVERPVTVRIHDCTYFMGNEPRNTAKTLRDLLRTARTTTTLLKFADMRYGESTTGTFVYVVVEPGYPKEVEIVHRKDGTKELGLNVRFREVSFA